MYIMLDKRLELYVGDASGRKNDHSSCDRYFAHNIGCLFMLPETFFMGINVPLPLTPYDILESTYIPSEPVIDIPKSNPFVIFMCGYQGSGKSTWVNKIGIPVVNQDVLKTKDKCIKTVNLYVSKGTSFVIDKIFPSRESRQEYLNLIPVTYTKICVHMDVPMFLARHNNETRLNKVSVICYRTYRKHFTPPLVGTEFDRVYEIRPYFDTSEWLIDYCDAKEQLP